ncbi:hypothetical protein ACFQ1S_23830, partial [Kibdelosporangium lantanae]
MTVEPTWRILSWDNPNVSCRDAEAAYGRHDLRVRGSLQQVLYLGTDTGRLWKTTDLGAHWTEFTGRGLPTRWVNAIVVDPT